jgi:hypothetical protein
MIPDLPDRIVTFERSLLSGAVIPVRLSCCVADDLLSC